MLMRSKKAQTATHGCLKLLWWCGCAHAFHGGHTTGLVQCVVPENILYNPPHGWFFQLDPPTLSEFPFQRVMYNPPPPRNFLFSFSWPYISISNFCWATSQNNPHKYVLYNWSHLLQPCGKFLSWASPIPLRNFYPLAPPPPRNCHYPSTGGVWMFSGTTQYVFTSLLTF